MEPKKQRIRLVALFLICAMLLPYAPLGVEAVGTITADPINTTWNDESTMVSAMAGQPYYRVKGTSYYYDEGGHTYTPHYTGDDLWVTAKVLSTMLGVEESAVSSAMTAKTTTAKGWKLYSLKETAAAANKDVLTDVRRYMSGTAPVDNDDAGVFVIVDKTFTTDADQRLSCHNLATAAYGKQISVKINSTAPVTLNANASLGAGERTNLSKQTDLMKVSFWAKGTGEPQFKLYPVTASNVMNPNGFLANKFNPKISSQEYRYYEFDVHPSQFKEGASGDYVAIPVGPTSGSISVYGLTIRSYNNFTVTNADIPGTFSGLDTAEEGSTITFNVSNLERAKRYESIILRLKNGSSVLCESETLTSTLTDTNKACALKLTAGGSKLTLEIKAKSLDGTEYQVVTVTPSFNYGLVCFDEGTSLNTELTVFVENAKYAIVNGGTYVTLQSAFDAAKSGDTVSLLEDTTEADVVIPSGVTLNIGEYTLTANSVKGSTGSKLIAKVGTGKLVVPNKDKLTLDEYTYVNEAKQTIEITWDSTNSCFVFKVYGFDWTDASTFVSAMAGEPYYMYYGQKVYYHSNKTYTPAYDGTDLWLTSAVLAKMFDSDTVTIEKTVKSKKTTANGWELYSLKATAEAFNKTIITQDRYYTDDSNVNDRLAIDSGLFVIASTTNLDKDQKISCHNLAAFDYGTNFAGREMESDPAVDGRFVAEGKVGKYSQALSKGEETYVQYPNMPAKDGLIRVGFWAKGSSDMKGLSPSLRLTGAYENAVGGKTINLNIFPVYGGPTLSTDEWRYFQFEFSSTMFPSTLTTWMILAGVKAESGATGKIYVDDFTVNVYNYRSSNAAATGKFDDATELKANGIFKFTFDDVSELAGFDSVIMKLTKGNEVLISQSIPVQQISDNNGVCQMELLAAGKNINIEIYAVSIDGTEYPISDATPLKTYHLILYRDVPYTITTDIKGISWYNIKGENVSKDAVVKPLQLVDTDPFGNSITWSSDNEDVISSSTGKVTRQEEDVTVRLTATISGSEAYVITLTVPNAEKSVVVGGEAFATVEEAVLAAQKGQEVLLTDDIEAEYILIPAGVTLNLDEFTLTAKAVVGMRGSSIGGGDDAMLIVPDKESLCLYGGAFVNQEGEKVLPLWSTEGQCYVFATFGFNTESFMINGVTTSGKSTVGSKITCYFNHYSTNSHGLLLCDNGGTDNGIKIVLQLTWTVDGNTAQQQYIFSDEYVQAVAKVSGSSKYKFVMSDYKALGIANESQIELRPIIITDCGAVLEGDIWDGGWN